MRARMTVPRGSLRRAQRIAAWLQYQAFGPTLVRGGVQAASLQHVRLGRLQEQIADGPAAECNCGGTGVVLVDGPCDAAPLEAPCVCLADPSSESARAVDAAGRSAHEERSHGHAGS